MKENDHKLLINRFQESITHRAIYLKARSKNPITLLAENDSFVAFFVCSVCFVVTHRTPSSWFHIAVPSQTLDHLGSTPGLKCLKTGLQGGGDVFLPVVHEEHLPGFRPDPLQGLPKDPRIGLCVSQKVRSHRRREESGFSIPRK